MLPLNNKDLFLYLKTVTIALIYTFYNGPAHFFAGVLDFECLYWQDRTDRNLGIGLTEQPPELCVLTRPNRP